jgi:hypothetical protein
MAKLIISALFFVCLTGLATSEAEAQYVGVDGYWRSNGTYVQPHIRTYPDGNPFNNLRR